MSSHPSPIGRFALGLVALALAAIVAPRSHGAAQTRIDARTVAARVQAFHDQTQTFSATFYQTYYNKLYGRYDRARGVLAFKKPGRLRFDYSAPNGKLIVSDGEKLTVYEPGASGAAGQYFRSPMSDAAIPAAFTFLIGTSRLERDFSFRLLDASRWGFRGHVLELRPRRANATYKNVILFVDADPARAGVVHRVLIIDHDGNRNKFELASQRFNRPMNDGAFAWSPPRGARRVQL